MYLYIIYCRLRLKDVYYIIFSNPKTCKQCMLRFNDVYRIQDRWMTSRSSVTTAFCILAVCTLGFIYGSSPLVLPVAIAFAGAGNDATQSYASGYG